MGRCDFLRKLLRNLGIAASPSQSHEDEEGANLGIRPFPLRADLPPPEKSGAVRHVELVYTRYLVVICLILYVLRTNLSLPYEMQYHSSSWTGWQLAEDVESR